MTHSNPCVQFLKSKTPVTSEHLSQAQSEIWPLASGSKCVILQDKITLSELSVYAARFYNHAQLRT